MEQPAMAVEPKMEASSSSYSQADPAPASAPASTSTSEEEAQFIAKHAQALQEFLSKPSSNSNSAGNPGQAGGHYYSPLTDTKDNKVTSQSANGQTKA